MQRTEYLIVVNPIINHYCAHDIGISTLILALSAIVPFLCFIIIKQSIASYHLDFCTHHIVASYIRIRNIQLPLSNYAGMHIMLVLHPLACLTNLITTAADNINWIL